MQEHGQCWLAYIPCVSIEIQFQIKPLKPGRTIPQELSPWPVQLSPWPVHRWSSLSLERCVSVTPSISRLSITVRELTRVATFSTVPFHPPIQHPKSQQWCEPVWMALIQQNKEKCEYTEWPKKDGNLCFLCHGNPVEGIYRILRKHVLFHGNFFDTSLNIVSID